MFDQEELIQAENLDNAVEELFKNKLFFDYNKKFAYWDDPFYSTDPKNILTYSVLVDQDNCEVKENHKIFKDWQQDKAILYSCNLQIKVYELQEINLNETYFKNQ